MSNQNKGVNSQFILIITLRVCVAVSLALIALNLFGLTKSLRTVDANKTAILRFDNEEILDYKISKPLFERNTYETDLEFAKRITSLISDSLLHIEWLAHEPSTYNQLVPAWENFILWSVGKFTKIPEFNRYHFTLTEKSLERGIGICGDASMLMSNILKKEGVDHSIIVFPGHVLISLKNNDKYVRVLDPDFGIDLEYSLEEIVHNPSAAANKYLEKGYTKNDAEIMNIVFDNQYAVFRDTKHFITKKYYFERLSYLAIWLIPLSILTLSGLLLRNFNDNSR